ncbi:hypothetical protein [Streptomyces sp. NPDC015130]|uniref:hypothetical protein n=1 Tax=Streptomyces sp. NPDC015130 TaxID=3364940 RepID=UPI0036FB996B
MSTPTIDGYELTIGDDLGIGFTPDCWDNEMDALPMTGDRQTFQCGDCKTALTVTDNGLVYDIR